MRALSVTIEIDPIIPADRISDFDGIVFDVRDPEAFTQNRVAGAVRVPIEVWESAAKTPATSLANVSFWAKEIGHLGIDGSRSIAVYDDGRMTEAARVWFVLTHFGASAQVIDGGWRALQSAPLSFETGAANKVVPTSFAARVAQGPVGLVERSELAARRNNDVRVLDARTADEFSGQDLRKNPVADTCPAQRIYLTQTFWAAMAD
jgi:thiosulfate/3-mercaptopyruvate sulfurtransferase